MKYQMRTNVRLREYYYEGGSFCSVYATKIFEAENMQEGDEFWVGDTALKIIKVGRAYGNPDYEAYAGLAESVDFILVKDDENNNDYQWIFRDFIQALQADGWNLQYNCHKSDKYGIIDFDAIEEILQ